MGTGVWFDNMEAPLFNLLFGRYAGLRGPVTKAGSPSMSSLA